MSEEYNKNIIKEMSERMKENIDKMGDYLFYGDAAPYPFNLRTLPTQEIQNTYTAGDSAENKPLAFEDLQNLMEQFPPLEFCAFTVSYQGKRRLLDNIPKAPTSESIFNPMMSEPLGSLNAYVIPNQTEPIIKWSDKTALNLYREMMGDLETDDLERRKALKNLTEISGTDFGEMVRDTISIPTSELLEVLEHARRPIIEDVLPFLEPNPSERLMPEKKVKQGRTPFYSKFIKRR